MSDTPRKSDEPEPIFTSNIEKRKMALAHYLSDPLGQLAKSAVKFWPDQKQLDARFQRAFKQFRELHLCNQFYAMDINGIQISSVVTKDNIDSSNIGCDRSTRPYMMQAVPSEGMILSSLYINSKEKLTSLTAVQLVEDEDKKLGFLAAEFTLLSLPMADSHSEDRKIWLQAKGDPSIRSSVWGQSRTTSLMDQNFEDVISVSTELLAERGVFHLKLHMSSSRATLWLYDDPYRYRVHALHEFLLVPLLYPRKPYPKEAIVKAEDIEKVFRAFQELRNIDDTVYLRAGGLNIINGIVSLNFSCDGSHYLPADEFLAKGVDFWHGTAGSEQR